MVALNGVKPTCPLRTLIMCLLISLSGKGAAQNATSEALVEQPKEPAAAPINLQENVTIQQLRRDEESRVFLRWHWRCE